jgi:hypothetical protein
MRALEQAWRQHIEWAAAYVAKAQESNGLITMGSCAEDAARNLQTVLTLIRTGATPAMPPAATAARVGWPTSSPNQIGRRYVWMIDQPPGAVTPGTATAGAISTSAARLPECARTLWEGQLA